MIYTHSLEPQAAVIWSGVWNFIGVLVSSGAVAFGIISLLPVELILQVGSAAGFAMVFALLTAATLWNVGTWWLGLPASSSHTLIGSIIGAHKTNNIVVAEEQAKAVLTNYEKHIDQATRFIPTWVKVAVALALGMGTMVGWSASW